MIINGAGTWDGPTSLYAMIDEGNTPVALGGPMYPAPTRLVGFKVTGQIYAGRGGKENSH